MIALLGEKIGMTQVFSDQAELVPVTVVKINPNYVISVAGGANGVAGATTVRLATNPTTSKHLAKAQQGEYASVNVPLQRDIIEVRNFDLPCNVGDSLTVSLFKEISYVDAIGWSKGRGYQGVVRRHGFGGGRASHGSKFHREIGSTGMAAYPAKTLKNTKMAGRMAVKQVVMQNLYLMRIDDEKNIVMIRGSIPGSAGRKVIIRSATKRALKIGENEN